MDENLPSVSGVNLDDVRKLELSYSYTRPGAAKLAVEYVSGQLKVFEVDSFDRAPARIAGKSGSLSSY